MVFGFRRPVCEVVRAQTNKSKGKMRLFFDLVGIFLVFLSGVFFMLSVCPVVDFQNLM